MEKKKTNTITSAPKKTTPAGMGFLFDKSNYRLMLLGLVILALGFILMAGGRSSDPNVFDKNQVYSPVRITIAPIIILAGFVVEIFALFQSPKNKEAIK